jgi:hypothetical protein
MMENWTLNKWLAHLDECAKDNLYFEISGHDAGLLRDRINHLKSKLDAGPEIVINRLLNDNKASAALVEYMLKDNNRLRGAMQKIADGNVERPVFTCYREDGKPSKNDQCRHGMVMYYDCGECIADFVKATLRGDE